MARGSTGPRHTLSLVVRVSESLKIPKLMREGNGGNSLSSTTFRPVLLCGMSWTWAGYGGAVWAELEGILLLLPPACQE